MANFYSGVSLLWKMQDLSTPMIFTGLPLEPCQWSGSSRQLKCLHAQAYNFSSHWAYHSLLEGENKTKNILNVTKFFFKKKTRGKTSYPFLFKSHDSLHTSHDFFALTCWFLAWRWKCGINWQERAHQYSQNHLFFRDVYGHVRNLLPLIFPTKWKKSQRQTFLPFCCDKLFWCNIKGHYH